MFPHERSLVKKMEGKPFALLGINTDDNRAQLIKDNAAQQITWRSWWDRGRDGPICKKYKVHAFPTILVLDAKGIIRYKDVRGQQLEDAVEALLWEMSAIDKYLPDETAGVFVFNVKVIRESNAYTNGVQKSVDEVFKKDEVHAILKDAGLDPIKDIDRAVVGIVPGRDGRGRPFIVLDGRFDPNKLATAAESLGKLGSGAKKLEIGKVKAYEVLLGPNDRAVIAFLNKNTLILATSMEEMEQAIAKADGKKKTTFQVKELAKLIDILDPRDALAAACVADMPLACNVGGMGWTTEFTLAKGSIETVMASFTATNVINGKVVFSAKDADSAKALHAQFEAELTKATAQLSVAADGNKALEPLLKAVKEIKLSIKEQTITLDANGGPEVIDAAFKSLFLARAGATVPAGK
jgi:hypothetical protein